MALTAVPRRPSQRRAQRRAQPRERHPHGAAAHRRYTRFVHFMKVFLPAVAVVLLALVVAWPKLSSDLEGFRLTFAQISPDAVKTLSMVNARYFGIDENNKPFTVTADVATQPDPQVDIIVLDNPRADFVTKSGSGVILDAREGYYHQKSQMLDLVGAVSMYHELGYELHTEEAQVDLAHSSAHGTKHVTGQGPTGKLDGEGFDIVEGGRRVAVTGRSSMTLKGATAK